MPALPGVQRQRAKSTVDDTIDALAAAQYGIVSRAQLLTSGIPLHTIDGRVKRTRLHLVHRGVYRVGPVTAARAREMAAILACGSGAVLSHRTAGVLRHIVRPGGADTPLDITVVGAIRCVAGVRVHRSRLVPEDIELIDALPITSVARTLLDLAAAIDPAELEQAFAVAERERFVTRAELAAVLARYPRHRGAYRLRALAVSNTEPLFSRSEAETRLLRLIRGAQLRAPATNVRVHGFEVDLYWQAQRLVVEVDGYAYHSSEDAFNRDRRRDAVFAAAGIRVIRVTWRQIARDREATVARIAQALVVKQ